MPLVVGYILIKKKRIMKKLNLESLENIKGGTPKQCWNLALYSAPFHLPFATTLALGCLVASL
ncbi:hypothetical protein BAY00_00245 [Elizabethkingia bruuniana]|nr:hypothetical protein BAY00_00245 [Elizabethkingia bruuniana]